MTTRLDQELVDASIAALERARTVWSEQTTAATASVEELSATLAAKLETGQATTASALEPIFTSILNVLRGAADEGDHALHHGALALGDARVSDPHVIAQHRPWPAHSMSALADVLRPFGNDVFTLVAKLLDDPLHDLGTVRAIRRDGTQLSTLRTLRTLAARRLLGDGDLQSYLDANPGAGPLFDPVPSSVNRAPSGIPRTEAFVATATHADPVRSFRGTLETAQLSALTRYVRRLRATVEPAVFNQLSNLFSGLADVQLTARTKLPESVAEKVRRRSMDNAKRSGVPDFTVGHVLDAVGVRLTTTDTRALAHALTMSLEHFGTGNGGGILSEENLYVRPRAYNPALRGVTLNCRIAIDGVDYPFEFQLLTRRTIIAADLDHNTVYKPYIRANAAERKLVKRMLEESAALDQDETRRDAV